MGKDSAVVFVLKALVPYTRENLLLSFKPARFFAELERVSGRSRESLGRSYYHAKRSGYLTKDPVPQLTRKGRLMVAPFVASKLDKEAKLMIVFDIPERSSMLRQRLRRLLRNLKFRQVQKSVWIADYDHRDVLREAVLEMDLAEYVEIYECAKLPTKTDGAKYLTI